MGAGEAPLGHPPGEVSSCTAGVSLLKASTDNSSLAAWIFVCQMGSEGPSLPIQEASAPPTRALILLLPTPAPCPRAEPSTEGGTRETPGGDGSTDAGEEQEGQEQNPSHVLGNGPVSPCSVCTERAACAGSSPARAGRRWTSPRAVW